MIGITAARLSAAFIAALVFLPLAPRCEAAGEWQVPEAALRYKLSLSRKPTHATAGYYAQLPDGGILRAAMPSPVVMTEDGKVVPSFVLWQNSESGFSIVFADPGSTAKSVYVYARTDRPPQFWKPESGLTPSAILCASPGRDTIAVAQNLAKMGRVEAAVHSRNKAGIPRAPLSIGGDETGRPRPGSFYLLSYVDVPETAKYWFSPFILDGAGEVLIDGARLTPKESSKKWGGTGASFDLKAGLHRVEIFQTAPGTGPYDSSKKGGGLMYLTWRTPKDQLKELEARVIKDAEIARSGACALDSVEGRDGAPVACAWTAPGLTYWFEDEEPLIIFDLQAIKPGKADDTTYSWTFPEGGTLEGKNVQWLFPGFRESRVKLVAKNAKGVSQCVVPLYGFGTLATSLDKAPHREAFRAVLGKMLEAYPRNPDPVAGWSEAYWNNLLRTVEGGEGYPVLRQLFTDRWETVRKKLGTVQVSALQDVLLDIVQRDNPGEAVKWLEKFHAGAPDFARRNELKLHHAEVLLFYLGDRKSAEQVLTPIAGLQGELGERAKVRLGDLAFLEGDLNKATSYYADVQNRARAARNAPGKISGGLVTNQLLEAGAAKPNTPEWKSSPLPLQGDPKAAPAGRGGALHEVSLSENVRTLTDGGYLLEARQALQLWEREFPLSKVSGDFINEESALYMKSGDWRRAKPMLEAYCREIDASSFLPDAAAMLITCVKQLKEPPGSIREIIEKVKGRLKYHPVAKDLDAFLSGK